MSELPAATVTHSGGYSELLNSSPTTEFGRYGLVAGWDVVPDVGAVGWVGPELLDLEFTFWDVVPGVEAVDWVGPRDMGVAAESSAFAERDGAG